MKKGILVFIIGILLLGSGIFLYVNKKEPVKYFEEVNLSREKAVSVMKSLILDCISVYEDTSTFFNTEDVENSSYIKVLNYENIKNIFTENGITQLESMKFGDNNFYKKEEDGVYLLKDIPSDNKIINSSISFDKVSIKSKEISSDVTFSNSFLDDNDNVLYKIITKKLIISKVNDNWYIDNFDYSNK